MSEHEKLQIARLGNSMIEAKDAEIARLRAQHIAMWTELKNWPRAEFAVQKAVNALAKAEAAADGGGRT